MKRIKTSLLRLCLSGWLLYGCASSGQTDRFMINDCEGETLYGHPMKTDSASVSECCDLVVGNNLIMYNLTDEGYAYRVYLIKNDSLLFQSGLLTIGNGAYEMLVPEICYDKEHNEVILYSQEKSEKEYYRITPGTWQEKKLWKRKELPDLPFRDGIAFLSDTAFLTHSYTGNNTLFSLSYAESDPDYISLEFPYPDGKNDLDLINKWLLYQGKIIKRAGRNTFLYSSKFFKYIILFDLKNNRLSNLRYLASRLPAYTLTQENPYEKFALAPASEQGVQEIAVTEKYIYLGYNNLSQQENVGSGSLEGFPFYYFDKINVFDWEGNFIRRLILDRPVYAFAADETNRRLYASFQDPGREDQPDEVLYYELPR